MNRLPLWVKKAIVDAFESGVAAVAAISFVVPNSLSDAKAQALVFGVAFLAATIAAFRRAFLENSVNWFRNKVLGGQAE